MLRLIRFLIFGDGHLHQWEAIRETSLVERYGDVPHGMAVYCRCKVCGAHKRFEI